MPATKEKSEYSTEKPAIEHDDNLHPDENGTTFNEPTAAEEAAVIRKLDWRLLPLVFVLYTVAILDRSNLGNAKLAGMENDIDLSGNRYNWLGTVFYIAYILFQWTSMGWKHFRPSYFAAFCVFFWGFMASIQAAVHNWQGLMACRFLLGIAEAMFGPGVPLYLTFFYPREKVAFRQGVFISGAAMANAYGGALAYGITQIRGSIAPWRILFLIEGLPTLLFAILAFYLLPDSIREARFLNAREREVALHITARNQRVDLDHEQGLRWKEVWAGMTDPKSWIPAVMYFSCNVSYASLPLFVPTIISEMGAFSTVQSQGLSAPPYVLSFLTIILFCWLSDKFQMRGPFCGAAGLLGAIGFIINATTRGAGPRYFSIFLSVEIFASVSLLLAWISNSNGTESRRAGAFTVMYTIGQCGPLLGTNVFPSNEAPFYTKGMWISAAFCLLVAFLSAVLSLWLIHENKRIDKASMRDVEGLDHTGTRLEGKAVQIKYIHVW